MGRIAFHINDNDKSLQKKYKGKTMGNSKPSAPSQEHSLPALTLTMAPWKLGALNINPHVKMHVHSQNAQRELKDIMMMLEGGQELFTPNVTKDGYQMHHEWCIQGKSTGEHFLIVCYVVKTSPPKEPVVKLKEDLLVHGCDPAMDLGSAACYRISSRIASMAIASWSRD
ncbi:hypothetical protein [Sporisorium scitamineum]|uniref:Uncharacterized protein n=1 Tax=Sporisorium scitamineum TaxID=49012 RepID=A0A0F7SBT4_9BASI|nr:hypothetical protein [Sporisorium scitamineum]